MNRLDSPKPKNLIGSKCGCGNQCPNFSYLGSTLPQNLFLCNCNCTEFVCFEIYNNQCAMSLVVGESIVRFSDSLTLLITSGLGNLTSESTALVS